MAQNLPDDAHGPRASSPPPEPEAARVAALPDEALAHALQQAGMVTFDQLEAARPGGAASPLASGTRTAVFGARWTFRRSIERALRPESTGPRKTTREDYKGQLISRGLDRSVPRLHDAEIFQRNTNSDKGLDASPSGWTFSLERGRPGRTGPNLRHSWRAGSPRSRNAVILAPLDNQCSGRQSRAP